jgi:hypothetical protein
MLAVPPERVSVLGFVAVLSHAYAVSNINDTVCEPALVEEFELRAELVGQRPRATADHDRSEEQMALVDQAYGERLAGELGTPDRDVRVTAESTARAMACGTADVRKQSHSACLGSPGFRRRLRRGSWSFTPEGVISAGHRPLRV